MSDNSQKPSDLEPGHDDLELDDIDLELDEDFDDDFDDGFDDLDGDVEIEDEDSAASLAGEADTKAPASVASKDKTFLQKYFYFVVAGIVVIFGGLFMVSQMGGNQNTPTNSAQNAVQDETAAIDTPQLDSNIAMDDGMPPQPAAMQASEIATAEETSQDTGPVLTPLPDLTAEFDATELPDLSEDSVFVGESDTRATAPVSNIEQEPLAPVLSIELGIDDNIDNNNSDDVETPVVSDIQFDIDTPSEPEVLIVDEPVVQTTRESNAINSDIAALEEQQNTLTNENERLETSLNATQSELNVAQKELSRLKNEIADANNALEKARTEKQALKQDIATLESEKAAMRAAQVAERQKPKPVAKSAVSAPVRPTVTAPVKTANSDKTSTKTIAWTLRAAQPGQAAIAPKGSNDLRTVRVGDTVPGLGNIRFIGKENGLWLVRGSIASVSQ